MQHPLLNPVQAIEVHREYPISLTLASGEIVEGIIDLAWSDGESWTVIDYKTGKAEARSRLRFNFTHSPFSERQVCPLGQSCSKSNRQSMPRDQIMRVKAASKHECLRIRLKTVTAFDIVT